MIVQIEAIVSKNIRKIYIYTSFFKRFFPGIIKGFTGISDPYEEPESPELRIDTVGLHPELAAHRIFVKLESLGFIR